MASILVIDDSRVVRTALKRYLQAAGHQVAEAADTREARAALAAGLPDLIVLDLSLPEENGIDFCRSLRRQRATRAVPVVILSANLEMATFLRESPESADAYLSKDAAPGELLAVVAELLGGESPA